MKVIEAVDGSLEKAREAYEVAQPESELRILQSEIETLWHKLEHLLYLPVLGLADRPRDLYYYQGAGLKVLYGFTYKYLPGASKTWGKGDTTLF